ncbi:hypothetical protein EX30DRAFT_243332 [Ascodesmis nigricans]|uniref:Uncharacterized protein n=1 Tax=Ascodesmis nigricans TaxID=341454 RepID=A0A4S2MQI7_9PEZI|nr:hypothetical protein EX30DRAFT_243332 [Ascodesmis nigricans]
MAPWARHGGLIEQVVTITVVMESRSDGESGEVEEERGGDCHSSPPSPLHSTPSTFHPAYYLPFLASSLHSSPSASFILPTISPSPPRILLSSSLLHVPSSPSSSTSLLYARTKNPWLHNPISPMLSPKPCFLINHANPPTSSPPSFTLQYTSLPN